jgi:hypothetical protein
MIFYPSWKSESDIPSDEEKEEEWEMNPKRSHIYPWRKKLFPKIHSRPTTHFDRFTPVDAIISYFPHNHLTHNENNKGSSQKFGQKTKT